MNKIHSGLNVGNGLLLLTCYRLQIFRHFPLPGIAGACSWVGFEERGFYLICKAGCLSCSTPAKFKSSTQVYVSGQLNRSAAEVGT